MKAILKGLMVVLVTLGLFAASVKAGTQKELQALLTGKRTVYAGTCHLDDKGLFTASESKYTVFKCIVGVSDGEAEERYYALILDNQGNAIRLILVDKSGEVKQEVLWTRGTSV